MGEAGFSRPAGEIHTSSTDGPFTAELKTNAALDNEQEMHILASGRPTEPWQQPHPVGRRTAGTAATGAPGPVPSTTVSWRPSARPWIEPSGRSGGPAGAPLHRGRRWDFASRSVRTPGCSSPLSRGLETVVPAEAFMAWNVNQWQPDER